MEKSSYYYQPQRKEDAELIVCLNELSEKHPSYGFKKMFHSLRNQGFGWNHKKVYRVYKKLGLNLTRKRRRNSQYMHYYYYLKMIRSLSFTQRKGVLYDYLTTVQKNRLNNYQLFTGEINSNKIKSEQ